VTDGEDRKIDGILREIHGCREELARLVAWKDEQRRNIDRFYSGDWQAVLDRIGSVERRMANAESHLMELRGLPAEVEHIEARQDDIEKWRVKVAVYATLGASLGGVLASIFVALIVRMLTTGF